jgi:hypothetical protein
MARLIHQLAQRIKDTVATIPELELLTEPDCAIVPIVTTKASGLNIYAIASQMEERGWNMFTGQLPAVMGICLGEQHAHVIDQLVTTRRLCLLSLQERSERVRSWVISEHRCKRSRRTLPFNPRASTSALCPSPSLEV